MIFLYIIYLISVLWAVFSILLHGARPTRSIGWLLVVVLFPFIGIVTYVLFGINRKKFKFLKLDFNAKRKLYSLNHKTNKNARFKHKFEQDKYERIERLLKKSSGFPAVENNNIKVLKEGESVFSTIFNEVSKAEKFIHIQYYILEEGMLLNKLLELLIEKIKKGVEVRILYDAFGSYRWKNAKVKELEGLGADIYPIFPIKYNTILSTLNYRNHQKIIVVDGTVAFAGGVNISDKYIENNSRLGIWSDLHLKIEGPMVDHLHRVFIKDFYFATNKELLEGEKYLPIQQKMGNVLGQIVIGGPDLDYQTILYQYTTMIHAADESIYIENPYFIPDKILLEALKMAVLRGVEVVVMVPKNSDSIMAKNSMYANFENLLKAGVEIRVLKSVFSHSKLIIIDCKIASIGSGNFDYRSFEYNYEVNALLYDENIAKELVNDFKKRKEDCEILNYETFKNRDIKTKLMEGCAKVFSPLL